MSANHLTPTEDQQSGTFQNLVLLNGLLALAIGVLSVGEPDAAEKHAKHSYYLPWVLVLSAAISFYGIVFYQTENYTLQKTRA